MRQPRSKAVGPLTIQGSWAALLRFGQALVLIAVVCVVPVGCASLPLHVQKHRSEALKNPGETSLGRLAAGADEGRGLSGIRLLASGDEALASLLALADRAERTLDLQYYIIAQDESARMVLQHVRKAAERAGAVVALRARGMIVVDVPATELRPRVLDAYVTIKERGTL